MCHRSFGYIVAIAQGPDGAGETLPDGRGGNSEQLADLGAGEGVAVAEGEKLPNLRRKFFVPLARRLHLLAAEQVRERSPRVHELGRCLFERHARPFRAQIVDQHVPRDRQCERQRAAPPVVVRLQSQEEPLEGGRADVLRILAVPDAAADESRDGIVQVRVESAECLAVAARRTEEELVPRGPEKGHRETLRPGGVNVTGRCLDEIGGAACGKGSQRRGPSLVSKVANYRIANRARHDLYETPVVCDFRVSISL